LRANSFKNYVSTLSRYDNSTWKPIKTSRKPILASPPLRLESPTQERWEKSNKEKAAVFAKHLADVFQPHEQENYEEILEHLEPPAQSVEPINPITPKEIKKETGLLHTKKSAGYGLNNSKNVKGITS
jgi:hypothetical protein